jgi:hypothetical protein
LPYSFAFSSRAPATPYLRVFSATYKSFNKRAGFKDTDENMGYICVKPTGSPSTKAIKIVD